MTWPFLGAVGGATLAPQAQQAPLAAAAAAAVAQQQQQQLVLTPRSAQRRRYNEKKLSSLHFCSSYFLPPIACILYSSASHYILTLITLYLQIVLKRNVFVYILRYKTHETLYIYIYISYRFRFKYWYQDSIVCI